MTSREVKLVETFVVPNKRERYVSILNSPKRRAEFVQGLYHFRDFRPECEIELRGPTHTVDGLLADLRRRGAQAECYVISVMKELDGTTGSLDQVIRRVYGVIEGTLVCCVPGQLAYYEGEAPRHRFILARRTV